jgi:hypothetical protein
MKTILFGALALLSIAACGEEVVVENHPSSGSGPGGAGAPATTSTSDSVGGASATSVTTGSSKPSEGCTIACSQNDGTTCSCAMVCPDTGDPGEKISCKPIEDGKIECVCVFPQLTFAGVCYEKNNAACDFDKGCCTKYQGH